MAMNYDVQIGNTIRRRITYAELVELPLEPDTFVRRSNGEWMQAKDCIELTHVLMQMSRVPDQQYEPRTQPVAQPQTDVYDDEDDDGYDDDDDVDADEEEDDEEVYPTHTPTPQMISGNTSTDYEEERIFMPTAEYFKCKQKRKTAIIGVLTLGLAGMALVGIGNTWRGNIFAGTSFMSNGGIAFVLKCVSFMLLTALVAVPYFIYSVFALIYYSIRLHNMKH